VEFVRWTKENETPVDDPGVGATIALALIKAIGKGGTFERSRDLAAWLGLVPRRFTTDGQIEASGHQQAGQQISSQVAHLPRASVAALRRQAGHAARPVDQSC
jgi:transposase